MKVTAVSALKLESLSQTNQNLLAQVDSLQETNRHLDAENKSLAAGRWRS